MNKETVTRFIQEERRIKAVLPRQQTRFNTIEEEISDREDEKTILEEQIEILEKNLEDKESELRSAELLQGGEEERRSSLDSLICKNEERLKEVQEELEEFYQDVDYTKTIEDPEWRQLLYGQCTCTMPLFSKLKKEAA